MSQIVVAAGKDYLDIDAVGGIVAYAGLLQAQGKQAIAASSAPFNASVSKSLLKYTSEIRRDYSPSSEDRYAVIDLSDPQFFDGFINLDQVICIIDHHVGFESIWQAKIGNHAHIEFVGAACTLVFEQWQQAGLIDSMSQGVASLLAAGIIDNTLNFKAKLTTERDLQAYDWLKRHAQLSDTWAEEYLAECQSALMADFSESLASDTKIICYPGLNYDITIGQAVVLDAAAFLTTKRNDITKQLGANTENWYMNILDLSNAASHFYTTNHKTQTWLSHMLGVTFNDNLAVADRLWLRKEIYKKATNEKNSSK